MSDICGPWQIEWDKWNYRVKVVGVYNNEVKKEEKFYQNAKASEHYNVRDCEIEKKGFLSEVITDVGRAGNEIISSLGMKEIAISPEQVHFVSQEFLDRSFDKNLSGKVFHGHAYVEHTTNELGIIGVTSHEMSHLLSYVVLLITVSEKEEGGLNYSYDTMRSGLTHFPPNIKSMHYMFDGVSEVCTEILAGRIREIIVPESCEVINTTYPYNGLVTFFREMIQGISNSSQEARDIETMLLRDYIAGTYDAFRLIFGRTPKLAPYLRWVRTSDEYRAEVLEIIKKTKK